MKRGLRNGVAPYIPASFCRDAGSAGHGATGVARPFRSLQTRGFASGMEARQGGDSSAGSVHDSPPRQGDARKRHKQERNGKKRKKKNSNHRNITSGKNIPDTSQTGRVTGDAPAWPASLPAGASLPGVFTHRTVATARNRASGFGGDWQVRQQLPVGVGPDDRMPPGSREPKWAQ